jgi:hypothetical protein
MDEITEKWEKYGLLEGISMEDKKTLAHAYNNIAKYLLDGNGYNTQELETWIFPCIRRIFPFKKNVDPIDVYHSLYRFYGEKWDVAQNIVHSFPGVDVEAEFIAMFCEEYTKPAFIIKKPRRTFSTFSGFNRWNKTWGV